MGDRGKTKFKKHSETKAKNKSIHIFQWFKLSQEHEIEA